MKTRTRWTRRGALLSALAVIVGSLVATLPTATPPAQAAIAEGTSATLAEYWNGDAEWTFIRKESRVTTGVDNYSYGGHVEVMPDGTWYYFSRTLIKTYGQGCSNDDGLGTVVRKSTNKGVSWSAPATIIVPTPGTAYSCYATDGDAYYNAATNTWHYLFQCHTATLAQGCTLSRAGSDPMGPFTIAPTGGNPTVASGELWNQICNTASDDCSTQAGGPGNVGGEGTFNIFQFDGTYYWVTFHGYDGVRGYQGIAKTTDFQNWVAGDTAQGVPADAIFDRVDSQAWNETWASSGSIGGGKGVIVKEGAYYYNLIEAADLNLACTAGQKWDLGIYRSTSLTSSSWSAFPKGNPIVSSSTDEVGGDSACTVQYQSIFTDPTDGYTYLEYGRRSADPNTEGVYWFRLEKSRNLLKNADLWKASLADWSRQGATTNYVAYRTPKITPDGTPYLEFNCGASCTGTNSVYQDVAITGGTAGTLSYGGRFATAGGSEYINLTVFQMDATGAVLKQDNSLLAVSPTWTRFDRTATLVAGAVKLRYQAYVYNAGVTFRADDMYLKR